MNILNRKKHRAVLIVIIHFLIFLPLFPQTWTKITIGQFSAYSPIITVDEDGYLHMGDAYQYTNSKAQDPATVSSGSLVNFPYSLPQESGSYFPAIRYANGLPHIAWRISTNSGELGVAYWNPGKTQTYDLYFNRHGHYPSLQVSKDGTVHIWYQADDDTAGVNVFYQNSKGGAVQKMIPDHWDMGTGGLYDYTTTIDKNGELHWLGAVYRSDIGPGKRLYHNYTTGGIFQSQPELLNFKGYFPSMAVDSNNHIHAVWQNGDIWYSEYDGSTWTTPVAISTPGNVSPEYEVYQQVNDQDMNAIRPVRNNMNYSWTCGAGGIFMSNDNWETFDIQYVDGTGYRNIFPYDTNYVYCVGDSGKLWRTRNGGKLLPGGSDGWEQVATGFSNNLNDCWFLDTITGYAVGQSGIIIKTTDRGNNWTQINHGLTTKALFSICFADSMTGYTVGGYGTVLKTFDGGTTWQDISLGGSNRLEDVFTLNDTVVWAVGDNKTVEVSYDGGTTWNSKNTGIDYLTNVYSVWFVNDTLGYVTGSRTGTTSTDFLYIYKTTDGGTTWTGTVPITGNNEDAAITGLYFINENLGFACGGQGKIYRGIMGTDADYFQPGIAIDQNGYCHVTFWGWSDQYHTDRNTYYVNNIGGSWNSQQQIGTSCYTGQTDGNSKIALDFNTNTIYVGALEGSSTTYGDLIYTRDINIRKATSKDITTTITASSALTEPTQFPVSYNSSANKLAVFDFTATDVANDGLDTKIKRISIQRGPQATSGIKFSDLLGGAMLYWGTDSIAADTIMDYTIRFGTDTNVFATIPEGTAVTFTLKTWLKSGASYTDGSDFDFKISAAHDVHVDTSGSHMTIVPGDITSGPIAIKLKADRFVFSNLPASLILGSNFTVHNNFVVSAVDTGNHKVVTASCSDLTITAVLPDSTNPANGTLTVAPSGAQSLSSGEKAYTSVQISQGHQYILLKASGTVDGNAIVGYSDSIKVLPVNNYLIYKTSSDCAPDDTLIGSSLTRLGMSYDVLNRCNDYSSTLPAGFLDNYRVVIVDEKNMYAPDSTLLKDFLVNASSGNQKGLVIFGSYIYGYMGGLPARGGFMNYFGIGSETVYPSQSSFYYYNDTVIFGTSGDLIGDGLLSYDAGLYGSDNVRVLCPSSDSVNTRVVFTAQLDDTIGYPLPVAIRHKGTYYKTFRTGFYIDAYGTDTERDTLLNRVMNWITTSDTESTNRTPYFTDRYNSKPSTISSINEDSPFSMSVHFADPDADAITASAPVLPQWLTYSVNADSITLTGTPDIYAVGDTLVDLKVSDPDGNYSVQTTRLRINHVNHKPGLSGSLPDSVKAGQLVQSQLNILDPDTLVGDTYTFSLVNTTQTWLSVDNSGLLSGTPSLADTGTYSGTVIIQDSGSDTASLQISTIVYFSGTSPVIAVDTNTVYDTLQEGATGMKQFWIFNTGNDTLTYSISTTQSWLSVTTSNGSVLPGDSIQVDVNFDASALTANDYSDTITINSNDASNPSLAVAASLSVQAAMPQYNVSDTALHYVIASGQDIADSIKFWNTGQANLDVSVVNTSNFAVLSSNYESLAPDSSFYLDAWWWVGSFGTGTYYDTLVIGTNDPSYTNTYVYVTIDIVNSPIIQVSPVSTTIQLDSGMVKTDSLQISNTGNATLNWSATNNAGWLTLQNSPGSVASGNSMGLVYQTNSAGLTAGNYYDTIEIISDDPVNSLLSIPVKLTVSMLTADALVMPDTLFINASQGNTSFAQLMIRNTGTANLNWTAGITAGSTWASSIPQNGTNLLPGDSVAVQVNATADAAWPDTILYGNCQIGFPGKSISTKNVVVKFIVSSTAPISNITINNVPADLCAGGMVKVTFSMVNLNPANTNEFWLQLSNSTGVFSNPPLNTDIIGKLPGTMSDTIFGTLPSSLSGSVYRMRVVMSSPYFSGTDNGFDITIHPQPPKPVLTLNNASISSSSPANNVWLWNGSLMPQWTGSTIQITNNGDYQVYVDDGVCQSLPSDTLKVNIFTGLDENLINRELTVYPVPAHSTVNFELNNGNTDLSVNLVDIESRYYTVPVEIINTKTGVKGKLDVSKLKTGIYYLQIISGQDRLIQKIIVRH